MKDEIETRFVKPDPFLQEYVDSFWMLKNHAAADKEVVVVPDSRVDLFFSYSPSKQFNCILMGLGNQPTTLWLPARILSFAVSFNLLALEYVLKRPVADLVNGYTELPAGFWNITSGDLNDFDQFQKSIAQTIKEQLTLATDDRKRNLFRLIYSSNGSISVNDLSEKVFWSSRQINRYFKSWFGISLKSYCNIVRFRASFQQIAEGRLFPEENFADQPHFIRQIRKLSGVSPKNLFKNQNDRFVQFSPFRKK